MFDGCGGGEESARVERGVAEVFITHRVQFVCAGFQYVIFHTLALKLRFGTAGLYLKLLYGFYRNSEREVACVPVGAGAGERDAFHIDFILVCLSAVKRSKVRAGDLGDAGVDAGHKVDKLCGIARHSVHGQRQGGINFVAHGSTKCGVLRLQHGRGGIHRDGLCSAAHH